ncbi:MAG: hypothetical protein HUU19_11925 [Phycisphaerales bacterium]|nr:hypothetical protein [Phycisphaerales bacterium]
MNRSREMSGPPLAHGLDINRTAISIAVMAMGSLCTIADAQDVDWWPMLPNVNPVLDGRAAPPVGEWDRADYVLNRQGDGTFRAQWQRNWTATSSSLNQVQYPGVTLFDMHDLWGYLTSDTADYNTFEYTLGATSVRGWVFANDDEPDDSSWIGNSELGYASVDDRGFIVRLNGNSATDFHWLPGMPEPGDPLWNWDNSYGFFGRAGFNNSTFMEGLPLNGGGPAGEVYEVALYGGTQVWIDAAGGGGGGGDGAFVPCETTLKVKIKDPHYGDPAKELEIKILGPGHVNLIPAPSALALFGLAIALRRRR